MKRLITYERAVVISLILFGLIAGFHLTILIGMSLFSLKPLEFLWGGRLESIDELYVFELISLFMVIFNSLIVLIHSGKLKIPSLLKASSISLWIFFLLFILNTLGNITAPSTFEKLASVVTAILAFLSLRMALHKA